MSSHRAESTEYIQYRQPKKEGRVRKVLLRGGAVMVALLAAAGVRGCVDVASAPEKPWLYEETAVQNCEVMSGAGGLSLAQVAQVRNDILSEYPERVETMDESLRVIAMQAREYCPSAL